MELLKIQESENKTVVAHYHVTTLRCTKSYNFATVIRLQFVLRSLYVISDQYIMIYWYAWFWLLLDLFSNLGTGLHNELCQND